MAARLSMERQTSYYSDQSDDGDDGVSSLSVTQSIPVAAGPLVQSLLLVALQAQGSAWPLLAEGESQSRQKTQERFDPLEVLEEC